MPTIVTRPVVGQLTPQALQDRRLPLAHDAGFATLRALGDLLLHRLLGTPEQFVLAELPCHLVADLAGQLLQIDQRTRLGQFLLMFPSQVLDHGPDLRIQPAIHCLASLFSLVIPP
jgi:hypothetical protein